MHCERNNLSGNSGTFSHCGFLFLGKKYNGGEVITQDYNLYFESMRATPFDILFFL